MSEVSKVSEAIPTAADALKMSVSRAWPRWLSRGPLELVACAVISLGILMLLQPFAMILYTWSFVTMLFGTVMFMVVSKFPE